MKIEYRQGDLLESGVYAIAHGCNDKGIMGSGIAAQIRKRYPHVYETYNNKYNEYGLRLGSIHIVTGSEKLVVNMITQGLYETPMNELEPKRFASYEAIAECMLRADYNLSKAGYVELGMPMIGAGLGGGDWNIIESIIESNLKNIKPIVYQL